VSGCNVAATELSIPATAADSATASYRKENAVSGRLEVWSVHAATAAGAVIALLSIEAVTRSEWRVAFAWMIAAMVIDSIDGTLARRVDVAGRLPSFDGALLDNIVDYLNYVFVPAFILTRASVVPPGTETLAAAALLLSSAYQFCQTDAKTEDHFFKGFPSFWNVAVLYLFVLRPPSSLSLAMLLVLAIGVFVPIRWAYPSRMKRLRAPTVALTIAWGASVVAIVWSWPAVPVWLMTGSLAYLAYYAAVSLYLSLPRPS
jgi:phosphatidylcholine synthase